MRRSSSLLVLVALLVSLLAAASALAADVYDPPGRVARLSHSQGAPSFSPAGEDGWYAIPRNRPLVRGDRLWTDRSSRAEFQVGSAALRLDGDTSLEILELNDRLAQFSLSEGSVNLRVRRLYAGQEFEIATPSVAFVIDRPGNYRIDVDPRRERTTIAVRQGAGVAYGNGGRFPVRAGDAVRFFGNDVRDYQLFSLPRADAFDDYCNTRDRRLEHALALRYLDDDLVGYADLDGYGSWSVVASYGDVWFPAGVGGNWAPYRDGRWLWLEPWGWTWVDDAPWGFAPFHYGRWLRVANRWGWLPGPRHRRPVYAPALVVFIGRHGWSISIPLGSNFSIGWFPLGPRDVYLPPYRSSRDYFAQVNLGNALVNNLLVDNAYRDYSRGRIDIGQRDYAHRAMADAITAVAADVFANSRPVRPGMIRPDRALLDNGELSRVAPVAPGPRSLVGADAAPGIRPPGEVEQRQVIARSPPPPAERPFATRERLLRERPGQPLQSQPGQAAAPSAAAPPAQGAPRRNLRVIGEAGSTVDARATAPRGRAGQAPAPPGPPPPLERTQEQPAVTPTPRPLPMPAEPTPPVQQQVPVQPLPPAAVQAPERRAPAVRETPPRQAAEPTPTPRGERPATRILPPPAEPPVAAMPPVEQPAPIAQDEPARAQARAEAAREREARDRAARARQGRLPEAAPPPQDRPRPAVRRPANCLTPAEVEALRQATGPGQAMPPYVPCQGGG